MDIQSAEHKAPHPISQGMAKFADLMYAAANWVLLAFMSVMCIIMLTQIVSRYLFNTPLTWPEEIGRYLFIWIVFLGSAVAFRAQAHLGMDFATAKLPPGIRQPLARFVEVLILGFLILILYITPEVLAVTSFQKSPVIHISMNYVYLAFPVASGLMILDLFTRWFCPPTVGTQTDPA